MSAEPMLDPDWTPQRGYAHAQGLLAIIEQAEQRKEELSRMAEQEEQLEEEWRIRSIAGTWHAVEYRTVSPERVSAWRKIANVDSSVRANRIMELARDGQL